MSNAPPAPDPKAVAYLRGQLARNPWHESEAIITKRAKALRLEKRNPHAEAVDHSRQREEVRAALAKVRSAAFTGNVQDLAAQLEAAPLADFPDLAAAANRLRAILSSRAKLPTLVHAPDFDADFLDIFKQVLVSPARETAVVKERALIAFNRRALRKRGKRMIGLIRRELPELYALDKDWLDSLSKHKRRSFSGFVAAPSDASPSDSVSEYRMPGWLIAVIVIIVINIIRALARG